MCDMFTALAVVGTAISAGGSIMQGQQQAALAEAQAGAYEQQAGADRRAASYEITQEQRRQAQAMAAARAQVATSGVTAAGSPTEALSYQAGEFQMDLEAIKYGSQLRQNNLKTQADISRFQGKQAKTASFINAGSNFISGISQLYDPNRAIKFGQSPFSA